MLLFFVSLQCVLVYCTLCLCTIYCRLPQTPYLVICARLFTPLSFAFLFFFFFFAYVFRIHGDPRYLACCCCLASLYALWTRLDGEGGRRRLWSRSGVEDSPSPTALSHNRISTGRKEYSVFLAFRWPCIYAPMHDSPRICAWTLPCERLRLLFSTWWYTEGDGDVYLGRRRKRQNPKYRRLGPVRVSAKIIFIFSCYRVGFSSSPSRPLTPYSVVYILISAYHLFLFSFQVSQQFGGRSDLV